MARYKAGERVERLAAAKVAVDRKSCSSLHHRAQNPEGNLSLGHLSLECGIDIYITHLHKSHTYYVTIILSPRYLLSSFRISETHEIPIKRQSRNASPSIQHRRHSYRIQSYTVLPRIDVALLVQPQPQMFVPLRLSSKCQPSRIPSEIKYQPRCRPSRPSADVGHRKVNHRLNSTDCSRSQN